MKIKKRYSIIILFIMGILLFTLVGCKSEENPSVGKVRLNIETYLAGKNQVTHPSVISFEKEWNGYKYWMVYTPYPEANGEEENPCIAVSNDLYKWETPYGMVNPIADNEETGCNELKDGHILYRDDLDRLEVWYLGRVSKNIGGDGESLTLFRKVSKDGIHWSDYEIMDAVNYLSPAVLWKDGKYQMWSIGFGMGDAPAGTFVYQESKDGENWTKPKKCSIGDKNENLTMWHGSVNYDLSKGKYIFVYNPTSGDSQCIMACESEDGIHFTESKEIVKNDKSTLWNHFYRPCLLSEKGMQHLFYGVVTEENKWYLSYSRGESLGNLKGITEKDIEKMVVLNDNVTNTKSFIYVCKKIYHAIKDSLRLEVGIFVIFLGIIRFLFRNRERRFCALQISLCLIICMGYTYFRLRPGDFYGLLGMLIASLIEAICIFCVTEVCICRNKKRNDRIN